MGRASAPLDGICQEDATEALPLTAPNTGQHRKPHVLVIDDEPRIVNFLRFKLKLAGYQVITADSGEQGLELARTEEPDVILLDLTMPGKDGFEVLKELRTFSQVPVVVVSARGDELASRVVGVLGANDSLGKPFNPEELIARIERIRWGGTKVQGLRLARSCWNRQEWSRRVDP